MTAILVPKILPSKEVTSMRPNDRERYTQSVILEILKMNSRGVTISEIASKTGFYRDTIGKHLDELAAIREAYKVTRGNVQVYYRNGQVVHAVDVKDALSRNRTYTFYKLENEDGKFIYIQEKEIDEFRAVKVKGGIIINAEYALKFLKELQHFIMGVKEDVQ